MIFDIAIKSIHLEVPAMYNMISALHVDFRRGRRDVVTTWLGVDGRQEHDVTPR